MVPVQAIALVPSEAIALSMTDRRDAPHRLVWNSVTTVSWQEDEEKLARVEAALRASRQRPPFPEVMGLPHLVAELRVWLTDDRQWRHASAGGWKSLLEDLRTSLKTYPNAVIAPAADPEELLDEIEQCTRELKEKELRREELLRRRLSRVCDRLEMGLATPAARTAAWDDLLARALSQTQGRASARRLFDLAASAGLDGESLLRALEFCLEGGRQRPISSAALRLSRAGQQLTMAPGRETITVWLRLLFAPLRAGTLAIGPRVQLFQASWLVPRLDEPDSATPIEAANDDGSLRSLARADDVLAAPADETHVDTPWALVRIDVPNATAYEAVGRARRTAATLGALGTLYGADPSLWRVDDSFVTFRSGKRSAASFAAPVAESPTFVERVAVGRDPTAAVLRHTAERLGALLPVARGRMNELAQLMLWLREARSSPPAARLVLCDRAIETVSGWAGVPTPRRFVELHLIPSWSRRQMLGEFRAVAIDIYYNDQRRVFPVGTLARDAWATAVSDPALRLRGSRKAIRPPSRVSSRTSTHF